LRREQLDNFLFRRLGHDIGQILQPICDLLSHRSGSKEESAQGDWQLLHINVAATKYFQLHKPCALKKYAF
jgi:hypothetical protein